MANTLPILIFQLDGAAIEFRLDNETLDITEKVSKEEEIVNKEETLSIKEITDKVTALGIEISD